MREDRRAREHLRVSGLGSRESGTGVQVRVRVRVRDMMCKGAKVRDIQTEPEPVPGAEQLNW